MAPPSRASTALHLAVVTLCAVASGLMLCLLVMSGIAARTGRDFSAYWAAGQQLAAHANPYNPAALDAAERFAGLSRTLPTLFVRNPPWIFPILYPLGLLNIHAAILYWIALQAGALLLAIELLRRAQAWPADRRLVLLYLFGPALVCITNGQTSTLCLLGLAGFLYFTRTRPSAAGACLWLCALKPHLVVPFGIVLLLWIVRTRRFQVLAGFAIASAAALLATWAIDPAAWSQYLAMLRSGNIARDIIPCIPEMLRRHTFPDQRWIAYIPLALAVAWAVLYYRRRQGAWDWNTHGASVILASVIASPYLWLNDLTLALPAIGLGVFLARSQRAFISIALFSAAVEIPLFANAWVPASVYIWTEWAAPFLLLWYAVVVRNTTPHQPSAQ